MRGPFSGPGYQLKRKAEADVLKDLSPGTGGQGGSSNEL